MQALFTCAKAPSEPMTLTMGGLTCPVRGQTEVKIGVYLNEQPIFEGVAPYEECVLGSASWDVSPALFVDGTNRIRITNLEEDGPVSNRPWFGMESVELAAYEKTPET